MDEPFYLSSLSYLNTRYWFVLTLFVLIQVGGDWIACDHRTTDLSLSMVKLLCLMEQSYNVYHRQLVPPNTDAERKLWNEWSASRNYHNNHNTNRNHSTALNGLFTGIYYPNYANANDDANDLKEYGGIYHKYNANFLWIDLVIVTQIFLLHLPLIAWNRWVKNCVESLLFHGKKSDGNSKKVKTMLVGLNRLTRGRLAYAQCAIEISCVFLLVSISIIWDVILANRTHNRWTQFEFTTLGFRLARYHFIAYTDPLRAEVIPNPGEVLFPTITKCSFEMYGPSGSLQRFDFLCTLSYNLWVEKIAIISWLFYWFFGVFGLVYCCRYVLLILPTIRRRYSRARLMIHLPKCDNIDQITLPYQMTIFLPQLIQKIVTQDNETSMVTKNALYQYLELLAKVNLYNSTTEDIIIESLVKIVQQNEDDDTNDETKNDAKVLELQEVIREMIHSSHSLLNESEV